MCVWGGGGGGLKREAKKLESYSISYKYFGLDGDKYDLNKLYYFLFNFSIPISYLNSMSIN